VSIGSKFQAERDICMSKEDKREIAVIILPWAGLKQNIQVGPVTFWPWDPSKIQDNDIKNQLEHVFKIFVDHYGKTVNTVTICSHGKPDFHILADEKGYNELQAARNILAFSSICPEVKQGVCSNNNSIAPQNSECFDLFVQKFKIPDDCSVVVSTRSSLNCEAIDKVHISMPWGVSNFWGSNPNDELIGAFDKVFDDSFSSETRERLFRSLEWFRLAHTEAKNVSDASRLVMMATAFEILLKFSDEWQKSMYFANQIENKLKKDKSISETRTHNNKQYTYTKAACWAYDFYQLRSKIVHGDPFRIEDGRYKDWINYNIVADLVFWELIVKELFENDCFGEEATEFRGNFNDFLRWRTLKNDYHKFLGWIK
jgi:hypothetical protein